MRAEVFERLHRMGGQGMDGGCWDMDPLGMRELVMRLESKSSPTPSAAIEAYHAKLEERAAPIRAAKGAVALIPIQGPLFLKGSAEDEFDARGMTYQRIERWVQKAMDSPEIAAIVFDIESPGGSSVGVHEVSELIYNARSVKPSYAVANPYAFSAAQSIAAAAGQFYVHPGGMAGSVGTYAAHCDMSKMMEDMGVKMTFVHAGKYKVEGNPFQPLNDEAKARMQEIVDSYHGRFLERMARYRGVTKAQAGTAFGEGRTLMADEAVARGLADRSMTLEQVLTKLGVTRPTPEAGEAGRKTGEESAPGMDVEILRRRMRMRERRMRV